MWINPDFQYSKLSVTRLCAFGSIYSNISRPTWLPELSQAIRIFFRFGPGISLTALPVRESSTTNSTGTLIIVNSNLLYTILWPDPDQAMWFIILGYTIEHDCDDDDDGFVVLLVVVSFIYVLSLLILLSFNNYS